MLRESTIGVVVIVSCLQVKNLVLQSSKTCLFVPPIYQFGQFKDPKKPVWLFSTFLKNLQGCFQPPKSQQAKPPKAEDWARPKPQTLENPKFSQQKNGGSWIC